MKPAAGEWVSVGQAAELLGVSVQTVRNYCGMNGYPVLLEHERLPSGARRISRAAVYRMLQERKGQPVAHWTQQDAIELARVLNDAHRDRADNCWPEMIPEAVAALEHLDAAGRLLPRPRETDDQPDHH